VEWVAIARGGSRGLQEWKGGGCKWGKEGVAGGGRIDLRDMVVGWGKEGFGTGGCRRWKDRVAGDGCRKGRRDLGRGFPEVEVKGCRRWLWKGEGGIWDGGGYCRRWKDRVSGDGCRKGKEVFWTGVCKSQEVEGTVAGEKKKKKKKTYAYCSVQSALWGVSAITL
jgi:hypothetical protein